MNDVFSTPFAESIFKQKYSMDQQETWSDTCKRVVSSVCGQLLDKDEQEEIYKIMYERKFIPGGRYLYSSGRPFHQVNNCFKGDERFITDKGIKHFRNNVGKTLNVLNHKGEWEAAEVKEFGNQELVELTLSNKDVIFTTENHLWIQPDGSRVKTKDLKRVMLTPGNTEISLNPEGIRHGIIFGDGYKHPKTGYTEIVIVNPKKDEPLVSYFENKEVEITVGFGGKRIYPTIRKVKAGTKIGFQPKHFKELPTECTPSYARGFIAGLIATDGHASLGGSVLISCEGFNKAKAISELAVLAGCVVSSVRINSKINPFNGEPRELSNIYIKPFSAPLILPYHQENMKRKFYHREMYLDVVSIRKTGIIENVYCVVAPKTNTFTLANGVITSNCFLFRAEDSREGWADAVKKATDALMTGGGIGFDYSSLREDGSKIGRTGGLATGPIALMNMVNETGRYVMQGGQRRSAIWSGLNWKHPDCSKFIHLKDWSEDLKAVKAKDFNFPIPMELTNISVIYDTEFFIAIEDKKHQLHKLAKEIWQDNCLQAFSTAEPGMSFNFRKDNESLRNACVTGETEILTKSGYKRIDESLDVPIEIWNGFEWSTVTPKITGNNLPIVTVSFSDGRTLNCTEYHTFHISTDYNGGKKEIKAKDLEPGMKLIKINFPVLSGNKKLQTPYLQGFHSAEGMDGYKFIYVYEPKYVCLYNRLRGVGGFISKPDNYKRIRFAHGKDLFPKSFVPLDYNLDSKIQWLAGLFDGDGTELKEGGLQLSSINHKFLKDVQTLLSTLGIQSKVVPGMKAGNRFIPDHKGGNKEFYCQESKRICIGAVQMQNLKLLGLKCERMSFEKLPQRDASQFISVTDITDCGVADTVYCFNEPIKHLGIFNGVITGQCTEVVSEDDSDKCNLGTTWINRIKDHDELANVTKLATKFLLCGGIYSDVPNARIREIGNKNNRIGLGLGGMHEWLMQRGNEYEVTPELHKWLSVYQFESDGTSFMTARTLGVNVPKGVRAIAPTGSIGILAESTTGLEPLFCKSYKRRYLKDKNVWAYQYVVDGSVKRLLDQGIKIEYIKDSYDLTFKQRVKFQADVQNYVDMSISSTCNLPAWGSPGNNTDTFKLDSKTLLGYAKRLRGFTCYPDGCRSGQPLTRVDLSEALGKEGQVFEENEQECVGGICGL